MLRTRKRRLWFCCIAVALNLVFIWGNSLLPGNVSAAISRFFRHLLSFFFSSSEGDGAISGEGILRKIAHILEFCSLGFFLGWGMRLMARSAWLAIPVGMTAGAIDETIQLFTPDRGPHIRDVGIDTLGVVAGIGVLTILLAIRRRKQLNMEENKL